MSATDDPALYKSGFERTTLDEARCLKLKRYFTGKPCTRGHIAERQTINSTCMECQRISCRRDIGKRRKRLIAWRIKNPDKIKLHRKTKYHKRRQHYIDSTIEWQKNNREKVNLKNSRWRKANPGATNNQTAQRRAGLKRAVPVWLTEKHKQRIRRIYEEAAQLNLEVDHIVPIRGKNVCGLHVPWNLQLLSKSENSSKGNRYVD